MNTLLQRAPRSIPWRIVAMIAIAATIATIILVGGDGGARRAYGQQTPPGVMTDKVNQALGVLGDPASGPDVTEEAVQEIYDALFTSNLVILPTKNNTQQDTTDIFNEWRQLVDQAIAGLDGHATGGGAAAGDALEASDFLQLVREMTDELALRTQSCNPADLGTGNPGCGLIEQTDQMPPIEDDVLGPSQFQRIVRGPFPIVGHPDPDFPRETAIPVDALSSGQCAPVVKELFGVAAVLRPTEVPVWIEPWTARARIIGFRTVWVWEFVPAEHIKTIEYCNSGGSLTQEIDSIVVLDRGALAFWSGLYETVHG